MSSAKRKTVPIGVGITDAYYRYQMETVECEHKGRRNKTVIKNMQRIGKDLNRSPEEVIKHLGHALSSSGNYSPKSREFLVNGTHSQELVQSKLQEYCQLFVVCGLCSNPETEYKVRREAIFLDCAACGGESEVDGSLKLCKYVSRRHKLSKQSKSNRGHPRKRGKNVTLSDVNARREGTPALVGASVDEVVVLAKQKQSSKKRVTQADSSTPKVNDYDDEFENPYFSTNGNPLFVGCFDRIAKAPSRDERAVVDHAVQRVQVFMAKNPEASAQDIVHAVTSMQKSAKILFSEDRLRVFVKAIRGSAGCALMNHANVLTQLTESDPSMEQYLIAVVEEDSIDVPKRFPFTLMQLYDADVVTEGAILEWWHKRHSCDGLVRKEMHKQFRELAKPLVTWLEHADCEDDEND